MITVAATFGLDERRARRQQRAAVQERRRCAYSRLLTYSGLIAHTAGTLHATIEFRSGLREGLDVALGHRTPIEPLELDSRLREDFIPLSEAWADVWTIGSREAVVVSNTVVDMAAAVVGAATAADDAKKWPARLVAQKCTADEIRQWMDKLHALADARRELAELARRELGIQVAQLFAAKPTPEPRS